MVILWLAAFLVFLVVEVATPQLVSVWFALGAMGGFICALIAPDWVWLQVVLFIVITALTLLFTRPLAKKHFNNSRVRTNADRLIGMTGAVTRDIDNIASCGEVFIDGKTWSARSEDGKPIPAGVLVSPRRIEGVKLIVYPLDGENKA